MKQRLTAHLTSCPAARLAIRLSTCLAARSTARPTPHRAAAPDYPRHLWLIACCALAFVGAVVSACVANRWIDGLPLIWQANGGWARPWTPWTAPLIGLTPFHTLGNVLALAAIGALGHAVNARPRDALALFIAWPLSTLGLSFWPVVGWYAGFSGVVHAATAVAVWRALAQRDTRGIGALLGAGLLTKLLLERGWSAPVAFDSYWGFNIALAAHLSGAVTGLATAIVVDGVARVFRHSPDFADCACGQKTTNRGLFFGRKD